MGFLQKLISFADRIDIRAEVQRNRIDGWKYPAGNRARILRGRRQFDRLGFGPGFASESFFECFELGADRIDILALAGSHFHRLAQRFQLRWRSDTHVFRVNSRLSVSPLLGIVLARRGLVICPAYADQQR